jgi:hypothetical protein
MKYGAHFQDIVGRKMRCGKSSASYFCTTAERIITEIDGVVFILSLACIFEANDASPEVTKLSLRMKNQKQRSYPPI